MWAKPGPPKPSNEGLNEENKIKKMCQHLYKFGANYSTRSLPMVLIMVNVEDIF